MDPLRAEKEALRASLHKLKHQRSLATVQFI